MLPTPGTKPFLTSELMPAPPGCSSEKGVQCLTEYMAEEIRTWENPSAAILGRAEHLLCCEELMQSASEGKSNSDYWKHRSVLRHV